MDAAQLKSAITALGKTPYADYLRTLGSKESGVSKRCARRFSYRSPIPAGLGSCLLHFPGTSRILLSLHAFHASLIHANDRNSGKTPR